MKKKKVLKASKVSLKGFEDEPENLIKRKTVDSSRQLLGVSSNGRLSIPKKHWNKFLSNWENEEEIFYTVKFNKNELALAIILHRHEERPFKCRKVQRYKGRNTKEPTTAYMELAPPLLNWGYEIKRSELFYVDYIFDSATMTLLLELKGHIKKV
jgi:hypothetical protein